MFAKLLQSILTPKPYSSDNSALEGGIYVTLEEDCNYYALKVLKTDEFGVHVRLYSNTFSQLPESIDESTLYLAGIGRSDGVRLGMGHIPVSLESFAAWRAQFVQQSTVEPVELDGYEMWKEAAGAYF